MAYELLPVWRAAIFLSKPNILGLRYFLQPSALFEHHFQDDLRKQIIRGEDYHRGEKSMNLSQRPQCMCVWSLSIYRRCGMSSFAKKKKKKSTGVKQPSFTTLPLSLWEVMSTIQELQDAKGAFRFSQDWLLTLTLQLPGGFWGGRSLGGREGGRTLHFPNVKLHFKRLQRHFR